MNVGGVYDAVIAKLALMELDAQLAETELPPVPPFNANDAVNAYEAVGGVNVIDVAADADIALLAQLLVPNNEPVIPCVTEIEPVTITDPVT
ncbi:MAG: hypothetical protein ACK55I_17260, partial [bacterium]